VIPANIKWIAALAFIAAVFLAGMVTGREQVQAKWDAATIKQSLTVAHIEAAQAEASTKVLTRYVDRIKTVRVAGETIIKEVPVYVPAEADTACRINRGFVRLHDATASGAIPDAAGNVDAGPAGIALSTVAGTVADNYGRCRENSEQLIALQEWAREMAKADSREGN
jgi:hypothetical protein